MYLHGKALHSLTSLSSLRHLDIGMSRPDKDTFDLLASNLPGLTFVNLHFRQQTELQAISFFSALLTLTQLTHLSIPQVTTTPSRWQPSIPYATSTATLHLLSGLKRLRVLDLGTHYVVDDPTAAALDRLPQLTSLRIHCMDLSNPVGGRLTALRHLTMSPLLLPGYVLGTLLPLRPLATLEQLSTGGRRCLALAVGADSEFHDWIDELPDTVAHAFREVMVLLSSSIHNFGLLSLVGRSTDYSPPPHLSLRQLSDGLRPWGFRMCVLSLSILNTYDFEWNVLGEALPSLAHLTLWKCLVTVESMASQATLTSLTSLRSHNCLVEEDALFASGGATWQGWLGLAMATVRPLKVMIATRFRFRETFRMAMRECNKAQREKYGCQSLSWVLEPLLPDEWDKSEAPELEAWGAKVFEDEME